ncbi:ATP-dependent DNA helicase PIF1 [Brachionus plicatilis]|uniref:ATP-dependent DNA helicase PIF1 n=1 Tax=Brachionus plicatilis TaxID=10195 RepID=A0A3M7QZ54_BRAPC|nr:ATP-dependent DNA helicase PIF1 [Brachionus plicatilis]
MIPGIDDLPNDIKKSFENLTMIEEMLISPILVLMSVFRLPGGELTSRGFCANFSQNIQLLITKLPRLPKDLPILILRKKDQLNRSRHFTVNRNRVTICLNYLCQNNPQYIAYGITIDDSAINSLPENAIPIDLNELETIEEDIISDKGPELYNEEEFENEDDDLTQTYVENDENEPLLDEKIKNAINFPQASPISLNGYETDSICSLAFPKLFPNGVGDPTKKARIKDITESLSFKHSMKSVAISYKTNEYYYPWPQGSKSSIPIPGSNFGLTIDFEDIEA